MNAIANGRTRFACCILLAFASSAAPCPTGWACASDTAMLAQVSTPRDSVGYVVESQGALPEMTIVFTTLHHGEITIDDLIGKIDSVLDGKRRNP